MGLVKAKMAFYHDSVGTRAHNEVFEVANEQVCAELEQAGYIEKVSGEEAQAHQEAQKLQEEMGQKQALTNEAIALAQHAQNVEANQHTQDMKQRRQTADEARQQAQQQADQQNQVNHQNSATAQAKANARKATEKE